MAKVIIDCNVFSQHWFKSNALKKITVGKRVLVVSSDDHKTDTEVSKVHSAVAFYKLMSRLKRLLIVSASDAENQIDVLNNCDEWSNCNDCDDPHIFAMVKHHPHAYIFTTDRRMSGCRKSIRQSVNKEFCQFTLIHADQTFEKHKQKILG